MSNPLILIDRQHPNLTVLTLNRPEKRNALSIALMKEFCLAYGESEKLSDQRVVIINGAGPLFCAGLDLHEAADPTLVDQSAALLNQLFKTIYNSPLISIAAVHGSALAGGAGIASACDFIVAAKDAIFGFPEIHRGLVAAQVSTLLRRQLATRQIRELLLLGEAFDAKKALEIGLINRIADKDKLMTMALELGSQILKGSPEAVKETKQLLKNLELVSLEDDLIIAMAAHQRARLSKEAKEGIERFFSHKK